MEDQSTRSELAVREPMVAATKTRTVFFGPDGLRAGWSLLLFFAMLAPLVVALTLLDRKMQPTSTSSKAPSAPPPTQTTAPKNESQRGVIRSEGMQLIILFIPTFILSRVERRPLAAYGVGRTPGALRQFFTAVLWGVTCLSLLVLMLKWSGYLVFDARLLFGREVLRNAAIWFAGFFLVGMLEEYFVRGYLQFTLARGLAGIYRWAFNTPRSRALGFWTAAALFSIVFGLGHGSNAGESPIGLLSAGLVGLVFCLSLWRTGSLWWAIGFHASWDWAQSFLYGVADSGTMIQNRLLATHPVGAPLLSGGATGPEGSIYVLPVLALIAGIILLTLPASRPAPANENLQS